jgi:formate hydrogenlyase transcriptional activator
MELHPEPEKIIAATSAESDPMRRALQENEDWYRDLVAHSHDLFCIHDLQGRLLSVNPAPARLLGYSVEEILQIPMQDLIAPEFRKEFDRYLGEIERVGEARGFVCVLTRSGERRIWQYHNTLRTEGVASPIVRGIAHDVTAEKNSEKRLREVSEDLLTKVRESEHTIRDLRLFRALVDQSNDAIEVVDPETMRFVDVNERACTDLGYSRQELLSMTVPDVDPGVTGGYLEKAMAEFVKTGSLVWEGVHRRKDGSTFPVEVSMKRVALERDYIIAIVHNLAERKRTEEALKRSEEKFSKLFHQGPMSITLTSIKDHRYLDVNEAFERTTGWRRDEVIGRTPFDIGLWVHPVQRVELAKRLVTEGHLRDVDALFRTKDGVVRSGLGTAEMIELNGEPCAISVAVDITGRKQTEEALRRSEERYRLFVSQSSEGIFREEMDAPVSVDLPEDELVQHIIHDSYVGECNDAMARMYGFESAKELVGKRLTDMLVADDPHNIELTRDYIRSGFRVLERESHEVDIHGNPKVIVNSMMGTVENGMLVRTWGIQRDVTEKVKLEAAHRKAEEALGRNVAQLQEVTEQLRLAKEKLAEEKLYLEQTIDDELGFGEIVGRSQALKDVMQKVAKVAPSDATVLLLGETGTGKELVARAIHRLSTRRENSFIKLNCAAIPSGLLESELFGHEKGAFTGAVARKLGRLELADKGTLFLDEIGEIPLSLQPKLLRVLQDMEFERLGATQTLKVNFRLLAATNRDLLQSVMSREFRSDLYYRLNVFPIVVPPLSERREDIRPLVEHFVHKFAAQMKKTITSIPAKTMEAMVRWRWPGNIRELENFLERSVILTPGSVLQAPLSELQVAEDEGNGKTTETLQDKERERILRALRDCHGKLGGPDGAAARLGLKRTTLQSKLDLLGIKPGTYRA